MPTRIASNSKTPTTTTAATAGAAKTTTTTRKTNNDHHDDDDDVACTGVLDLKGQHDTGSGAKWNSIVGAHLGCWQWLALSGGCSHSTCVHCNERLQTIQKTTNNNTANTRTTTQTAKNDNSADTKSVPPPLTPTTTPTKTTTTTAATTMTTTTESLAKTLRLSVKRHQDMPNGAVRLSRAFGPGGGVSSTHGNSTCMKVQR